MFSQKRRVSLRPMLLCTALVSLLVVPSRGTAGANRTASTWWPVTAYVEQHDDQLIVHRVTHESDEQRDVHAVAIRQGIPGTTMSGAGPAQPMRIALTYVVSSAADNGIGTLREAITLSNANPGLDQITFNLTGSTTITLLSALPEITGPIVIDGTTQPGYSGTPKVVLSAGALANVNALVLKGGGSTVRGLVINGFTGPSSNGFAIILDVLGGNVIQGNYLGINAAGTAAVPNAVGVGMFGGSGGNLIGGSSPQDRDVISGSQSSGIQIATGNVGQNIVRGNFIGLNAAGTAALGNGGNGVFVDAPGDTIGGSFPSMRNVISGNGNPGVWLGTSASGSVVQGNYIGSDVTGSLDLGNIMQGVYINGSSNSLIGGLTPDARNVFGGNQMPGISVAGPGASGNMIQGNYIGTDATGLLARAHGNGIVLSNAQNTVIGGATFGAGNLVSGNPFPGIFIGTGSTGTVVKGNRVGTNATGLVALSNSKGIVLDASTGNSIGGTVSGEGNVIAGNTGYGIEIRNGSTGNGVFGNTIGTDSSGTVNLGNGQHGIIVSASSNTIGGAFASAGNIIANNLGAGVYDSVATTVSISHNSIYNNRGLGIDLFPRGISPNDPLDGDVGSNGLQNFPMLDSVSYAGGTLSVYGRLFSKSGQTYKIECFANDTSNASHFGEGRTSLGANNRICDVAGFTQFILTFPVATLPNYITATATDVSGNTSEFSQSLCTHDADGDGIPDCWERQNWGIDINSDGKIDLDLYARGARPDHKDMFVEVDAMQGYAPPGAALDSVVNAFDIVPNAYLNNPDGQPGIKLHYQLDETTIAVADFPNTWSDFQAAKATNFGTQAERSDANATNILDAKGLVYRYCVFARTFSTNKDTLASGDSEFVLGTGNNDFMVTFGSTGVRGWSATKDVGINAGTFMHELGHTLGLGHGGLDNIKYKPNYYSVMNYTWQTPHETWQAPGTWQLDYSLAALPTLNEGALDETIGLDPPSGIWRDVVTMPFTDSLLSVGQAKLKPGEPVDWSGDGTAIETAAVADINRLGANKSTPSAGQSLRGFADWPSLIYSFRTGPYFSPTVYPPSLEMVAGVTSLSADELTSEENALLDQLPPPKPKGHFVMNGVLDPSARLLASNAGLNLYGAYADGQLYVATNAAQVQAADMVVLIADSPGALHAAPAGKSGQVGAWGAYLFNESTDGSRSWANAAEKSLGMISVDTTGTVLEGVIDVELLYGHTPADLYIAVGKYGTSAGGGLLAQVPVGNGDGNIDAAEFYHFGTPTGVLTPHTVTGSGVMLSAAWPNPSRGQSHVRLTLPQSSEVELTVKDVAGRMVATLVNGTLTGGVHDFVWNGESNGGRKLPAGLYFITLKALGETRTSRTVLVR